MRLLNINVVAFLMIAILYLLTGLKTESVWQQSRQGGDGLGYYIYLPSIIIYKDLGDFSKTTKALRNYNPNLPDISQDIYGFRPTPIGKLADKYPIGVALLQAPYFITAHIYTLQTGHYLPDGFSLPYQMICFFSTMIYVLVGIWFLQKTMLRYYSPNISAITILLIGLGTNIYFFSTVFSGMAHGYQFFAVCILIYLTDTFYKSPKIVTAIGLGAIFGLVVIIRSQDIIFCLIPILWNVSTLQQLSARASFLKDHIKFLIPAVIAGFLVISTQLIYYKYISGQWLYFSYVGETFNWKHPQIIGGLFSPQNGWFLYTPIMLPIVLSLIIKTRNRHIWILPLFLILCLHIYISYSWWCWYYIAGLGSRPMVDMYPLLSLALAGMLTWLFTKPKIFYVPSLIILMFLASQNLRFTYQQFNGLIFSEFNNWGYYKAMFLKLSHGEKEHKAFITNFIQPTEGDIKLVDTLYQSDFESIQENRDTLVKYSGLASMVLEGENTNISMFNLVDYNLEKGDWLKVSLDAHIDKDGFMFINLPKLVLEFKKTETSNNIWNAASPTALIKNDNNSIWCTGAPNVWEKVTYFTQIPFTSTEKSTLRIIGYNPSKIKWNMDNLLIEHFKNK